ncbi:MAG: CAP domain-containing protein, partial [Spirulinaceae cyanobacterium]
ADPEIESPPPETVNPQIQGLLAEINRERAAMGLPLLSLDAALMMAAQAHASDMAEMNFFSPQGSDGSTTATRVAQAGYQQTPIAENIGVSRSDPAQIVQKWLRSPGYRTNLLNPDYQMAGIGYAYDAESDFGHYWTLVLGPSPTAAAPTNRLDDLLALANEARQQACVPLLQPEPALTTVAQTEAAAIAAARPAADPSGLQTQLEQLQYPVTQVTALRASNAATATVAFGQWQQQANRQETNPLLSPYYTQAGLGVAANSDRQSWTLVLAEPAANAAIAPPTVAPFLQETGQLEPGIDPVLPTDGSSYDLYSFEAQAGQEVIITLNSQAFDPYLFLFNAFNIQIADNDDISGEDRNSQLQMTLPCDGEYKVMVNSYDPASRGEYTLSIYSP